VDPLGDLEELRLAFDHDPANVDARAPRIGDQWAQQLDDPASARRGVHVPDDAAAQELARLGDPRL
jgi:hypothetical protein